MTTHKKTYIFIFSIILTCLSLSSLRADNCSQDNLNDYFHEFPWMGLVANNVHYGPITISKVRFKHENKFVFASPGETIHGSVCYKIGSEKPAFHLYHLIIGIKGRGAQDCITHTFNLVDKKGKGKFTLKAPEEPGVYEVRFLFNEGLTCDRARQAWVAESTDPSAHATIGVVIVK